MGVGGAAVEEKFGAASGVEALSSAEQKAALYRDERITYWNSYTRRKFSNYYHRRLTEIYQFLIPPGQRVLEMGCGDGDLLASLKPSEGVGVDFSPEMIARARIKHPEPTFILSDAHDAELSGTFDYIVLSDLVNDLWDVERVFEQVGVLCGPQTRVVINTYSRLWELPLAAARQQKLANQS